jgi:hypothetical protein
MLGGMKRVIIIWLGIAIPAYSNLLSLPRSSNNICLSQLVSGGTQVPLTPKRSRNRTAMAAATSLYNSSWLGTVSEARLMTRY